MGELCSLVVLTLNLSIESRREHVPGVPAIYLVAPTAENVAIIARDTAAGFYDRVYVKFTTSLPRELLDDLALKTVESNAASRITTIVDSHNQFIGLELSLFTLNVANVRIIIFCIVFFDGYCYSHRVTLNEILRSQIGFHLDIST